MHSNLPGSILAIDLGEKRIGLALSDAGRLIARSYGMFLRQSRREDFARYEEIIQKEGVTLVLMGLPLRDGAENSATMWVRDYAADLARVLSVPVTLWDESYSSQQAAASLSERGIRAKKQKGRIDAAAAAFILQSYLEAHYPTELSELPDL